jgi:hypothetical protein
LESAKVVELRKGLPLQYLNGKYLVDLKDDRWKSLFIITLFKAVVQKFEIMSNYDLYKLLDLSLSYSSSQEDIVKFINKYIGKYVTFFKGSGNYVTASERVDSQKVSNLNDSASTLEDNLKKLAK